MSDSVCVERGDLILEFDRGPVTLITQTSEAVLSSETLVLEFDREPILIEFGQPGPQGLPGEDGQPAIFRTVSENLTVDTDTTRLGRNTLLALGADILLEGTGEFLLI